LIHGKSRLVNLQIKENIEIEMEEFTKLSSLEALLEFGKSSSVLSLGTIGFVVLFLAGALYACSKSDLTGSKMPSEPA
jgi:hypothetical protein